VLHHPLYLTPSARRSASPGGGVSLDVLQAVRRKLLLASPPSGGGGSGSSSEADDHLGVFSPEDASPTRQLLPQAVFAALHPAAGKPPRPYLGRTPGSVLELRGSSGSLGSVGRGASQEGVSPLQRGSPSSRSCSVLFFARGLLGGGCDTVEEAGASRALQFGGQGREKARGCSVLG
jgi:hypothetical protein